MRGGCIELARRKVHEAAVRLAKELDRGEYLAGGAFTVAGLTAAALFYPVALPAEYPFDPPTVMHELAVEVFDAPAFDPVRGGVAEMYSRHRGTYCSA
jgi:glutathione S-transferase